ncbi:MAG: hypothetical protein R2716_01620 [Microthrixaceae bacterium]
MSASPTPREFRAALLETRPPPPVPVPQAVVDPPATSTAQGGFGRSERRWLVPALGILMVASALVVAGALLRQNATTSVTPPSTAPPEATGPSISSVVSYDPLGRGDPGENDDLALLAVDGDPSTAWRTESGTTHRSSSPARTAWGSSCGSGNRPSWTAS